MVPLNALPIVWVAGVHWDGVEGTDRRMVLALRDAGHQVRWVEHPRQHKRWFAADTSPIDVEGVAVHPLWVPPGFSRPGIRVVTNAQTRRAIQRVASPQAIVVVASPLAVLPPAESVSRNILFVTDDWVAGATLMGLSEGYLLSLLQTNLARADAVVVVSPELERLVRVWWKPAHAQQQMPPVYVVPNGAPVVSEPEHASPRSAHAVLVGQVNARTDLALVRAVLDRGIALTAVGPLTELDESFRSRWEALVAHPLMSWLGRVPADEVAEHLLTAGVGLVPYTLSTFNRSSSPLKTLEYLASGLRVVSSALPSSAMIAPPAVVCASTPSEFADAVADALLDLGNVQVEALCRATAAANSWQARAARFASIAVGTALPRT